MPKLQEILTQHREGGQEYKRRIRVPSEDGVFGVLSSFTAVLSLHCFLTEKKERRKDNLVFFYFLRLG
jgi:hypothetical protein